MTTRLESFMAARAAETYTEPPSDLHAEISAKMLTVVAPLLPAGASVLDVGVGQGYAMKLFTDGGFKPFGITTNVDDLDECKRKGFVVGHHDMHTWTNYYDCVWARHVLEHSPIPLFVLFEFHRIMKLGGILYLEMPQPDGPCGHETHNLNHYSVFGLRAWQSLIVRSGFKILETRKINLMTGAGADVYFSFVCEK